MIFDTLWKRRLSEASGTIIWFLIPQKAPSAWSQGNHYMIFYTPKKIRALGAIGTIKGLKWVKWKIIYIIIIQICSLNSDKSISSNLSILIPYLTRGYVTERIYHSGTRYKIVLWLLFPSAKAGKRQSIAKFTHAV